MTDLILGTAQLRSRYGIGPPDQPPNLHEAEIVLRAAAEFGFTAVDTAPSYSDAETTIGQARVGLPIHTKIELGVAPDVSLARSFERLNTGHVEVLYLHDPIEVLRRHSRVVALAYQLIGEKVGVLGASVYERSELCAAIADERIGAVQVPINVLDSRAEDDILQCAKDRGMLVFARSVFLQGALAATPSRLSSASPMLKPYAARVRALAEEFGRSPLEVLLGWVRARPGVNGIVVGAASVKELREIASASRAPDLTAGELEALSGLQRVPVPICDPRFWDLGETKSQGTYRPRRVVAFVQARMGSVRFPGKVLSPVLGQPLLGHLLERLKRARTLDEIILAIPNSGGNESLVELANRCGIRSYRGNESDVLDRYHAAAQEAGASVVVRLTGDCPLVDPGLVDRLVKLQLDEDLDYVRTGLTYPDGFDVEVCSMRALQTAWEEATDPFDREHVTPFVQRDHRSRRAVVENDEDLSWIRVTLDEPEDLTVITGVLETFGHNHFTLGEVMALGHEKPQLFSANSRSRRNDGSQMGTGQKLWRRAKRVIPGGSMLLSKRAEIHLPVGWPAYFSQARGCRIWDLDGNEFVDVGLMGVGTNVLGYGHPFVDEAVKRVIAAGNLSTLNCPEEVALAEALIELHPWADMARFTRSGGEACAVAARIARAAVGKDIIAICGYHGWHDWYLAANLAEEAALDGHHLPGLATTGLPRALRGSARTFNYNDLDSLHALLLTGEVGVIFLEVERNIAPAPGFLQGVRALADRYGAVLVFDECTSGFRRSLGGLHLHYGVDPDIAVFGKTLGNGYAINAIIGRESVLQAAQDTFISSTFWTERIGPAAALATLEVMRQEDAPARIERIGLTVAERWRQLGRQVGLPIVTQGIPAISSFAVEGFDALAVRTFITEQLLASRFLAGTALYASIAHEDADLDAYFETLEPVLLTLASCATNDDLSALLPNGVAQRGFQRLT